MTYIEQFTQCPYTQCFTYTPTTSVGYNYMILNDLVPRDYQCVQ
jgi:hypothetical protein